MKNLIKTLLLLMVVMSNVALAQVKISTQEELERAWNKTHASAIICIGAVQKINGPKLSDEELSAVVLATDSNCSTVLAGAYLLSGTSLDVEAYANASTQRQIQSSEITFALKIFKQLVNETGYRPFPQTMETLLLMEINSK